MGTSLRELVLLDSMYGSGEPASLNLDALNIGSPYDMPLLQSLKCLHMDMQVGFIDRFAASPRLSTLDMIGDGLVTPGDLDALIQRHRVEADPRAQGFPALKELSLACDIWRPPATVSLEALHNTCLASGIDFRTEWAGLDDGEEDLLSDSEDDALNPETIYQAALQSYQQAGP